MIYYSFYFFRVVFDMPQFDVALLILFLLALVSYFSGNTSLTISLLVLIIFKLSPLNQFFPILQSKGLTIGIIMLTITVMIPIANGTIGVSQMLQSIKSLDGILAILIGILVAWLGSRGLSVMKNEPKIITGLIIGTLIGVSFLKGIPVGPLIAAGIFSVISGKI